MNPVSLPTLTRILNWLQIDRVVIFTSNPDFFDGGTYTLDGNMIASTKYTPEGYECKVHCAIVREYNMFR